jgi:hypothetical protein
MAPALIHAARAKVSSVAPSSVALCNARPVLQLASPKPDFFCSTAVALQLLKRGGSCFSGQQLPHRNPNYANGARRPTYPSSIPVNAKPAAPAPCMGDL